jgi:hypothetical protein
LKWTRILWVVILLAANSGASWSQKQSEDSLHNYRFPDFFVLDTHLHNTFPFVHFEANHFKFFSTASPNWFLLYKKFTSMVLNQNGKLNFYHIGGSHLQADVYTHEMRTLLQTNWKGLPGERGWVFPFDLAKTNGFPGNYSQFLEWSANLKTPKTSIYNNMPPAESEYSKVTGGLIAKRDDALRDAAENAQAQAQAKLDPQSPVITTKKNSKVNRVPVDPKRRPDLKID